MVRVESTDSPLSATAGVKTPLQGTGMCILACQIMSSCFCRFPAQSKVEVECLTRRTEKFLSRKVCAFFCAVAVVVHMFVLFRMQQVTECVTEMVRVESTDSPLSAMAGIKAPP